MMSKGRRWLSRGLRTLRHYAVEGFKRAVEKLKGAIEWFKVAFEEFKGVSIRTSLC